MLERKLPGMVLEPEQMLALVAVGVGRIVVVVPVALVVVVEMRVGLLLDSIVGIALSPCTP